MVPYHLVLPMGGAGSRFTAAGMLQPKPLIPIHGKPAVYWAARSLLKNNPPASITAVVLRQHVEEWQIDNVLQEHFPGVKIVILPQVLNGPTLTCLEGVKHVPDDGLPVTFLDCDVAFLSQGINSLQSNPEIVSHFNQSAGMLTTFTSNNPAYSYVIADENGWVTGTKEKEVVSSSAIAGCYWFRNSKTFIHYAEAYLKVCPYKEFFMSGIYNTMLEAGEKVMHTPIDFHLTFGTPAEYDAVINRPEWQFLK